MRLQIHIRRVISTKKIVLALDNGSKCSTNKTSKKGDVLMKEDWASDGLGRQSKLLIKDLINWKPITYNISRKKCIKNIKQRDFKK